MRWKLVPVEPTDDMSDAAERALAVPRMRVNSFKCDQTVHIGYRNMLAAAPPASQDHHLEQRVSDLFNAFDSETDDPVLFARAVLKMLEGGE